MVYCLQIKPAVFIFCVQQKAKDHFGIEGDEESTMYEDSVSPAKWAF